MKDTPREAALSDSSQHVLVEGEAGTGKTYLAVEKACCYLDQFPDRRVLFVSFSRASRVHALRRIQDAHRRRRAEQRVRRDSAPPPALTRQTEVSTFHSLALSLLRRYGHRLGLPALPVVVDQPEIAPRDRECADKSCANASHIARDGTLCFDGIIKQAVRLLDISPDIRAWLGFAFPLIIVDEFQDTSPCQADFLRLLSQDASQLLCLCDKAQRVFGDDVQQSRDLDPADAFDFGPSRYELPAQDSARRHRAEQTRQLATWARRVVEGVGSHSPPAFLTTERQNGLFPYHHLKLQGTNTPHGAFKTQLFRAVAYARRGVEAGIAHPLIAILALNYDTLVLLHRVLEEGHISGRGYKYAPIWHEIEPPRRMESLAVECLKGCWCLACGLPPSEPQTAHLRAVAAQLNCRKAPPPPPALSTDLPAAARPDAAAQAARQWLQTIEDNEASPRAHAALHSLSDIAPLFSSIARGRAAAEDRRSIDRLFSDFAMGLSSRDIARRVARSSGMRLMLLHEAKNREFDAVCLVVTVPDTRGRGAAGIDERLYVGLTRARFAVSVLLNPTRGLPDGWELLSKYCKPLGSR